MPSHISIIFHRKVLQILQQLPFSKHEWGWRKVVKVATDGQMACARNIISHIPKWIIIIIAMMCGQKVAAVSN